VIGGYLIAMQLPLQQIFLLLLVPLGIGTVASILMARVYHTSLASEGRSPRLEENPAAGAD
jgi:hypothetical protein